MQISVHLTENPTMTNSPIPRISSRAAALLLTCLLACSACGGTDDVDSNNGGDEVCPPGQRPHPITKECVSTLRDEGDMGIGPGPGADMGPDDAGSGSDGGTTGDAGTDDPDGGTNVDPDMSGGGDDMGTEGCDVDGDLHLADTPACGGDDCDDNNSERHPGLVEICDEFDNDCNMMVNDGLTCEFYAQTSNKLYLVDPFEPSATEVGDVPDQTLDMDTDTGGTLYAVTSDNLHRYNEMTSAWEVVGAISTSFSVAPNGLAIDRNGDGWLTAGNTLYKLDLQTAAVMNVGSLGRDGLSAYSSSGDSVVSKGDTLFMSSSHPISGGDELVRVSRSTGRGSSIGSIGFDKIWGMTAAWGDLYGLSGDGELIEIDESTGAGRLLHTLRDSNSEPISFFGAASTANR
jgi:hypothetical protein